MSRIAAIFLGLVIVTTPVFAQSAEDIANQVTIRRTAYGVPHISAETELAGGFGMGYAQAEDHCERIMRLILTARGELAATFGDVDNNVNSDFRVNKYRIYARALETFDQLDADWRDMLQGYAMGFSYYVEQNRLDLPNWVGPISAQDVAAHGLMGISRFALNRGRIVNEFLRQASAEDEDLGSNMWAFDGSRTVSSNTILMGNPHQPWSEIATYYEAHLFIRNKYNFYGSTFIGRPVLTTGFNRHLGWTHTVNYPDLEEIYAFDLVPNRPDRFELEGERYKIEEEQVSITVRTENGYETRNRTFLHTDFGPAIYRDSQRVYVLKSAAYNEFRQYQQWYRMGQAKSFGEFQDALNMMTLPMFNIGYADAAGNIYYLWNGTIPKLPHAPQRATALHATRKSHVWSSFHPLSDLPQLRNPRGGYVMNSNSPPYFTNLHEPIYRGSYPAYFPDNSLSLRSQHSLALIHNDDRFSLEDVTNMKFSMRALVADRVLDDLLDELRTTITYADPTVQQQNRQQQAERKAEREREKAERQREKAEREAEKQRQSEQEQSRATQILDIIQQIVLDEVLPSDEPEEAVVEDEPEAPVETIPPVQASNDPELDQAIAMLEAWDRTVDARSKGGPLFAAWWSNYLGDYSVYTDQDKIFAEVWDESNPVTTPSGLADSQRAVQAFRQAMQDLKQRHGSWDLRWGQIHRMRTGNKDLKIGGGSHELGCFRIVLYEEGSDGRYVANSGDSWIFAVEFGDPRPKAYSLLAYSQSSNPSSPHYNDQAELFAENRMKPVAFGEADIQAQLLSEYTPASKSR